MLTDFLPVAFVAENNASGGNPTTGDSFGSHMVFVVGMMMLSAACFVALLNIRVRKYH